MGSIPVLPTSVRFTTVSPLDYKWRDLYGDEFGNSLEVVPPRKADSTSDVSTTWACGAMVAQETFNFEVVGSSPVTPTSVRYTSGQPVRP